MSTFKKLALILLLFATVSAVCATEYPFWIEDDNETVWAKVNLTSGTNYIYVMSGAGDPPNGTDTFIFFDDFKDGLSKWTNSGVGISTTEGLPSPSANAAATYQYMYTNAISDVNGDYIIEYSAKTADLSNVLFFCDSAGSGQMLRLETRSDRVGGFTTTSDWTTWSTPSGLARGSSNTWYDISITVQGTTATGEIEGLGSQEITISRNGGYIGWTSDGICTADYCDNFKIRQYAETEPNITNTELLTTDMIKYTITSTDALENYQIKLNASLLNLETQSDLLLVSDEYPSTAEITINVTDITNRTVTMDYNSTDVDHAVINWGDGTTTITSQKNTQLTHEYEYDKNFTITARGYDESENLLKTKTTTAFVLLDMSYVENYYTLLVANPYGDLENYPLNLTFDSDNFDWWNTDIDPLGTNIYFRTNDTIYEHQIIEWASGSTTGNIYLNLSEIPANDYLTFYMCFASYDYPQFEVNPETEYSLLWTITDFQQQEEGGTFERVSTEVSEYQNITVLFVDEQTLISGTLKIGTIAFTDENGDRVVYSFDTPVMGSLEVSAATANGTIYVATSDGITRELTYSNSTGLNVVTLPNSYTLPVSIRDSGDVAIYTNGYLVTTAVAPADIYLALNGKYDIYLDGEMFREDYIVTTSEILYGMTSPSTYTDVVALDTEKINETHLHVTITSNINASLELYENEVLIDTITITEGTQTITVLGDTEYIVRDSEGNEISHGMFTLYDLGGIETFKSMFAEVTAMILALVFVIFTVLAGSYITVHLSIGLAAMEVIVFTYLGIFDFDPITKSIVILSALITAAIMWVKR